MLTFQITDEHYIVTDTWELPTSPNRMVKGSCDLKFSKDLKTMQADNDPPREVDEYTRGYFMQFYKPEFDLIENDK